MHFVQPTSSASPPPVGRRMNPVTEEPPSSPSAQDSKIAVRNIADAVGGGHARGGTAGVRAEYVGREKAPWRRNETTPGDVAEEGKVVRHRKEEEDRYRGCLDGQELEHFHILSMRF